MSGCRRDAEPFGRLPNTFIRRGDGKESVLTGQIHAAGVIGF